MNNNKNININKNFNFNLTYHLIIFFVIIIFIIFSIRNYKIIKFGNNTNKSVDSILNIESYRAKATITIKSNKTTNTYEVIQKYNKEKNIYTQEIISPEEMKGIVFTFNGKDLKLENARLNLNTIYYNYTYFENNELSLISFIEDYNKNENKHFIEDNKLILETNVKGNNKYRNIKKLYIDRETNLPIKMEIKDVSENTRVYILYNEIELNNK